MAGDSKKGRSKKTRANELPNDAASRGAAQAAQEDALSHRLTAEFVERALVTNTDAGLLEDKFGARAYAELKQLAREADSRSTRGGTRILILPGIMGSTLGTTDDEIWLDLLGVIVGDLSKLRIPPEAGLRIGSLGVMLSTYLKLKYRLRIGGFDADFWPYDWRHSIAETGELLAKAIEDDGNEVHLVAHSMGGLVARACLKSPPSRLGRIVTLGTPHHGSFSPLQAFRGAHSVVRKLAFIDFAHDQNDLAEIFGTFQGLSEMFPSPGIIPLDLFDLGSWPTGGPRPDADLLKRAKAVQKALPTGKSSPKGIFQIIGINQQTVVEANIVGAEFAYTMTNEGDGTVPMVCATLSDAEGTYYVEEEHGSLPNNATVAKAVQSLIATGKTSELPTEITRRRSAQVRVVTESELGVDIYEGNRGRRLSTREERHVIEEFAAPAEGGAAALTAGGAPNGQRDEIAFTDRLVISRQRHRHLDIVLAHGSLTDADADAYVLGLFKNVSPGGAALTVDRLLNGGISQALGRRMFNGNIGEVSVLPKGRNPLRADFVAFAGLGPIDSFNESTLEIVGENLIRTFVSSHVSDFATVLMGGSSGMIAKVGLQRLLTGFVRGLLDADRDQIFHRVTICETDPKRYAQLTRDLYDLTGGELFDGIQLTLRTRELPAPDTLQSAVRDQKASEREPVYVLVRQTEDENDRPGLIASVLTKGSKAAIHRSWKPLDEDALAKHLAKVVGGAPPAEKMEAFGEKLASMVLPDPILTILGQFPNEHVVVVHDAKASRIPWDAIYVNGKAPALAGGLSHRYEADDLSVAKWLEERRLRPTLRVLLVVDPTKDLQGARDEGDRVEALLREKGRVEVHRLNQDEARRSELLRCFRSGDFDVVHYAGHAFFDQDAPSRSGILCAGREVLSGAELAGLGSLPSLVFFNACEAGRVRRTEATPAPAPDLIRRNVGFAEAFLRGGVANYVGTYWPVGDKAAELFAPAFYDAVLGGNTLGDALMASRRILAKAGQGDWADYILYGDPEFRLKKGS